MQNDETMNGLGYRLTAIFKPSYVVESKTSVIIINLNNATNTDSMDTVK